MSEPDTTVPDGNDAIKLEQLLQELKTIEPRLGRPNELPDDMDRVRLIAHSVNNILTSLALKESLGLEIHALERVSKQSLLKLLSAGFVIQSESFQRMAAQWSTLSVDQQARWVESLTFPQVRGLLANLSIQSMNPPAACP